MRISTHLLLVTLLCFLRCSISKVSYVQVKDPGLFYIFVSGQVILLDAVEKRFVKAIRAYNKTGIPFPNQCPGNPFNGTWNDQSLGKENHTIFMSASYALKSPQRLSGLTDALYVVDTETQEIVQRVSVLDRPVHTYYIPFENSVWTHNDGFGTFTVIEASSPYKTITDNTTHKEIVVGHGKLGYDEKLGPKGFKTSVTFPGGYIFNLDDPTRSAEDTKLLNFTEMVPSEEIASCGGTHGIGYSSLSNIVYFGCIPNSGTPPWTIAIDGNSTEYIRSWNFTSSQLFTTPDQIFVIGLDAARSIANLLYYNGSSTTHYSIQLATNSTPSYLVAYPKDDYYLVFISLVNSNKMAVVDFNGVVECIKNSSKCNNLEEYLNYVTVGYHNPPGAPSSMAKYRPIDAGHLFVCTSALHESSVYCYNTQTEAIDKYEGFEYVQRVVFVEGELSGSSGSGNVSLKYDCSTAPTKIEMVTSAASSFIPSTVFSFLMFLFAGLLLG